jgi:hypothetical protein
MDLEKENGTTSPIILMIGIRDSTIKGCIMLYENYWDSEFDVTKDDLIRINEYLDRRNEPVHITELVKRLIRGRIRFGHDISPAALNSWTKQSLVKLWDPASNWNVGDRVVVITIDPGTNLESYGAFIGDVINIDPIKNYVTVHLEIGDKTFEKAIPGSEKAITWHNAVREVVAQKIKSTELEDQVTAVLAQYGDRIVSRLIEVLEQDGRFSGINNHWFINELIEPLSNIQVRSMYRKLIGVGKPLQLDLIKDLCDPALPDDLIGDFRLLRSLEGNPNLFQLNVKGTNKTWKAVIPEPDQMVVKRYAYDPNTYEIICTPGSKLNKQTSQRLQELGLMAHVVDFVDELNI